MEYVVFTVLIWTAALFHRREHRALRQELRALPHDALTEITPALAGHDWRITALDAKSATLKRAFQPIGRAGVLRYALPVVFLAVMMIVLQSYIMAAVYLTALTLRWFVLEIKLTRPPEQPAYTAFLYGRPLFGETL
jgi:hypothetical protein